MASQWGAARCRHVCWITTSRRPLVTHARFLLFLFFSVGQVVNIKAKVNRAFNSSMEVGVLPHTFTPCPYPYPPQLYACPRQLYAPIQPWPNAKYPDPPAVSSFDPTCQSPPAVLGGMWVPGEQSWLSGLLCPLPGGHPGELRGPVQREALQHLQGVRHLCGTGSLQQQGERWPVSVGARLAPVQRQRRNGLSGERRAGRGPAFHHGMCRHFVAICTRLGR